MATNLMNVFKNTDLKNIGKSTADVMSLAFKPNKKTGAKIARAVLSDGTTLIKSVTASGVVSETIHKLPEIASVAQRNEVIRDLAKQKINQETIAAMLDVSQSTVATVYKGNIIKNLIMDCQSYTKYRPNETTGGIFVSWRRKEELPTGA